MGALGAAFADADNSPLVLQTEFHVFFVVVADLDGRMNFSVIAITAREIAQVDEETLRSYVGVYQFSNGPTVTIAAEKGRLMVKLPQGDLVEIFPESATSFFSIHRGIPPLRFTRKDDNSVELTAGGSTAKRQ